MHSHLKTAIKRKSNKKFDYVTFVAVLLLSAIGVAFIYSTQCYNMDETPLLKQFWVRQIVFIGLGLCVYMATAMIDYKWFLSYAHLIYFLAILILVPLAIQENLGIKLPFVLTRFNATRWYDFKILSLQPSELAKIGTLIMIASILTRSHMGTIKTSMRTLIKIGIVFFIPILLIFLQPDLGSTLVFPPMLFAMLYVSRLSKRFFGLALAVFVVLVSIVSFDIVSYSKYLSDNNIRAQDAAALNAFGSSSAILPMKDYQRNRILSFVSPELVDPSGQNISWNYRQSLISVGSGGLLGKGHTEGTQAKLGYLPSDVAYNDFIFSVISEEKGFLGASLVIFLSAVVIFGCMKASVLAKDNFGAYLAIGIAAILMTHIFINIGMTIGIMPITGLPLPMLSYGGTFILTCYFLMGIVQSVYRHKESFA